MAQPVPPKNNYSVALPSRLARKNYSVALASRPSTRIPSQNGGALRFPLWGTCQKIIWQPHWENYMAASGLLLTKNNYSVALASRPLRKKIIVWHWLPAGSWTCHHIIIFSGKNHRSIIPCQEPDALICGQCACLGSLRWYITLGAASFTTIITALRHYDTYDITTLRHYDKLRHYDTISPWYYDTLRHYDITTLFCCCITTHYDITTLRHYDTL